MFVGHYSVAFAARSGQNRIPLWVLFIAVQFLDYIWATLVLLGIEKLRVIKGFTAGSMLDSYFHPYSHSLVTAVAWSVVAALIFKAICSRHSRLHGKSAPLIVGAAVFSHWVLDLIAHPRDLAIYDNTWKVGFGLWNYRDPEFALEIDTYVPRAPLTDKATAMGVWIFYTLFVAVAFLVEKIGRQRQINAP